MQMLFTSCKIPLSACSTTCGPLPAACVLVDIRGDACAWHNERRWIYFQWCGPVYFPGIVALVGAAKNSLQRNKNHVGRHICGGIFLALSGSFHYDKRIGRGGLHIRAMTDSRPTPIKLDFTRFERHLRSSRGPHG